MKVLLLLTALASPAAHAEYACSVDHDPAGVMVILCTRPLPAQGPGMMQATCCLGETMQKVCTRAVYDSAKQQEPTSCDAVRALQDKGTSK